jgi:hypothetical protein
MKTKLSLIFITLCIIIACNNPTKERNQTVLKISDEALMDSVQRRTFLYFWDGAEPVSGMARERYHVDGDYGQYSKSTVTSGGSGFGIMAIIAATERGWITRAQALERFERIMIFLENADSFHGVFPHWWNGETGKTVGFSDKDNGGDLVETSFLIQGLLTLHQYYVNGSEAEKALAARIDTLWRNVNWNWHRNNQNVLFWHWSPEHDWGMNHPIKGFDECLITYILAACSPTHGIPAYVYHEGWARNGDIVTSVEVEGIPLHLRYNSTANIGPMFWAHYSFLGLNPNGLIDRYADYFKEMRNYTLANRAYCIRNPNGWEGFSEYSWGLTASYSVRGYFAHEPYQSRDLGVIAPTAALSSIVYTPEYSMQVMRHFYEDLGDRLWGKFGFYDAFSVTEDWFPQRYLAIDQGPITVMIENHRTGLLWNLFMSHPDVQKGLEILDFEYRIKN